MPHIDTAVHGPVSVATVKRVLKACKQRRKTRGGALIRALTPAKNGKVQKMVGRPAAVVENPQISPRVAKQLQERAQGSPGRERDA